jgi:ABC-2 type transport system ATP-binding protein
MTSTRRQGSIRVLGFDVRKTPTRALAMMGVVFQQRTLDLDLSVVQNLHYHAALHGMSRRVAGERIAAELERLELTERAGDKVRELSGGQVRRVEIARSLLHQPRLLLLDEPTVGLDIGSRQGIIDHVRALVRTEQIAILWATHLIDEVADGDKVVVLHQGRILANGEVGDVVRAAGAATIREAFTKLTSVAGP